MSRPREPTLIRADGPAAEVHADLEAIARRLHGLRAGRKLALVACDLAFDAIACVGWSVWAVGGGETRDWLGAVAAPGLGMPPLREALARTAPRPPARGA